MSAPGALDRDALASLPDLRRALSYEGGLRSRTEGLTWMLWGLVTAAIFLSYGWAGERFEGDFPLWADALWAWWALAGAAFTWALWRTAALSFDVGARRPAGPLVTLLFVAAGALGWAVALLVVPGGAGGEVVPLLAVGTAWLLLGALDLGGTTPLGRRVMMGVGAAVALLGAGLLLLFPGGGAWHDPASVAAREALETGRILVGGLVPFLAGLWQATRG